VRKRRGDSIRSPCERSHHYSLLSRLTVMQAVTARKSFGLCGSIVGSFNVCGATLTFDVLRAWNIIQDFRPKSTADQPAS
jgi:hypothetical protein